MYTLRHEVPGGGTECFLILLSLSSVEEHVIGIPQCD